MSVKPLAILKQYWFFVGVLGVLTLGYAIPAPIARISAFELGAYSVRTWLIVITMIFTAFTLPLRNIGAGARNWVGLLLLLVMSYGVYPLVAWQVTQGSWWLQGIDPGTDGTGAWAYGAGLILMAAVPTTLASGIIWTRQAGGDDALALVGMVLSLIASIFFTPLVLSLTLFPLLATSAGAFDPSLLQTKLVHDLTYLILIPVAVGQGARVIRPLARQGDCYRKQISIVLQLIVLTTIWFSVASQMVAPLPGAKPAVAAATTTTAAGPATAADTPGAEVTAAPGASDNSAGAVGAPAADAQPKSLPSLRILGTILASTFVIHVFVLITGWLVSRLTRRSRPVTIAVGLNGAQKTLPVAILVLTLMPGGGGTLNAAVWTFIIVHVTQLLVDAALLPKFRAWSEAESGAAAETTTAPGGDLSATSAESAGKSGPEQG